MSSDHDALIYNKAARRLLGTNARVRHSHPPRDFANTSSGFYVGKQAA